MVAANNEAIESRVLNGKVKVTTSKVLRSQMITDMFRLSLSQSGPFLMHDLSSSL
jgi:hypothetical protein